MSMHKDCLHLYYQNAQYISNKIDLLGDFLEVYDPDVLCLVEHGLKSYDMVHLNVSENYHNISNYCRSTHKSGGALILAKKDLKITGDNRLNKVSEEMNIEVTSCFIQGSKVKLHIILVYRSPKGNLAAFFEKLTELLSFVDPNIKTVVVGDFNVDLLIEDSNSDSLINIMKESRLEQTVFIPTRVTHTSATLIDNLFTNLEEEYCKVDVVDSALSDHYGIDLNVHIDFTRRKDEKQGFFTRHYTNDIHLVNANLTDLSKKIPKDNVNSFVQKIANQQNLYFPLKFKQVSVKVSSVINPVKRREHYKCISNITNKMHQLRRDAENFQCNTYLELKRRLREQKRMFKETILKARSEKVKNAIINTTNIGKTTWNIVNSYRSSKYKVCKIEEIASEGKVVTKQEQISNILNDHFVKILNRNSRKTIDFKNFDYLQQCESVFYINPIAVTEVEQFIDGLKNKKSEGHDGISNHYLKLIKGAISPLLTHYINQSIMDSTFPECLKEIKVIPLCKGGDATSPNNYRPLSIVSPISKIYEVSVVKQLNKFLKINNILCENQFGFREKLSTEAAILKCYETVCAKKKCPLLVITVDMSKAFDSVNHNILLYKLKKMGFGKRALDWIRSFISRRKQYVHLRKGSKKYNSKTRIISGGIAQGSMIGPLLFLLFINDLAKFLKIKVDNLLKSFFDLLLFADDVLLILSNHVLEVLEIDAFIFMNYFLQWCEINFFSVNLEKSNYLFFNSKPELTKNFQILLDGEQLDRVTATKYLGVLLDDELSFDEHIDSMCKKLHAAIFVLKVLARFCDLSVLIVVYHSLFVSHIQYCINAWSNGKGKKLEKVFLVQKRAIRTMLKLKPRDSCREYFIKLQLLTVPALIIYSALKFYHAKKSQEIVTRHSYNTRNQRISSLMEKSTTMTRAHKYYSKIPSFIKHEIKKDERCFNKLIKNYLIELCPYSIGAFLEGN